MHRWCAGFWISTLLLCLVDYRCD